MSKSGDAASQTWSLIVIDQLTPRMLPVLSSNNIDELCILGGKGGSHFDMECYSDGVIFNVKTQEITTINPDSPITFCTDGWSFLDSEGRLLSFVYGDD